MSTLATLMENLEPVAHTPWPRAVADAERWHAAAEALAAGELTLLAYWGEAHTVHLAMLDEAANEIGIVSRECVDGHFPSIAARHPPAQRLERAICDLFGHVADGALDTRPWLDHGKWGLRHPLGTAGPSTPMPPYAFLPVEGQALHQIPVGPVHAGIIEPGHFRFTASGETVVRLEERLGYVHKGIEGSMTGARADRAARLAARVSGDSTVAYSIAFAQAIENALGAGVPERAQSLRAIMLELERVANHFGDVGAICNDAAFPLMLTHCGVMRERALRAADAAFGHRLMMDRVIPGGIADDIAFLGRRKLSAFVRHARRRLPSLLSLYDETASLQDRTVSTGIVRSDLVRQFGTGGYVGRASGRGFDARRNFPFAPYNRHSFEVPVLTGGDVDARVRIRFAEIAQSLELLTVLLDDLPKGLLQASLPQAAGEGAALVEGFRGDVFVWARLDADGSVARCHLRDPSWFQWPLLEAAIENNIVADFPLCNKSFNCSYSGHDL